MLEPNSQKTLLISSSGAFLLRPVDVCAGRGSMKIYLVAVEAPLYEAFLSHCGDLDFVSVKYSSILDLTVDAVVSPANFWLGIRGAAPKAIWEKYHGELLVGQAELVATEYAQIPWLIAAPTMRVPMILTDSVNPFLAARAALRVAQETGLESVAFPGLGTGVGWIEATTCAYPIRQAIGEVLLGEGRFPSTWAQASDRHQSLYTTNRRNLQKS